MQPRNDRIGIELNYDERMAADLALSFVATSLALGETVPNELHGVEQLLPTITQIESLSVDLRESHIIIAAARYAMNTSDHRAWLARNRYSDLRHDHADIEDLAAMSLYISEEESNVGLFRTLFETAQNALNESEDYAIDSGLKAQST